MCWKSFLFGMLIGILLFLVILYLVGHFALSNMPPDGPTGLEAVGLKIGFGFAKFLSLFSDSIKQMVNLAVGFGSIVTSGSISIGGGSAGASNGAGAASGAGASDTTGGTAPAANAATFYGGYY